MSLNLGSQLMFQTITTEQLVAKNHPYRTILAAFDFSTLCREFRRFYSVKGAPAYDVEKGVKALILQFMEDYSDRQMERAVAENNAVKWFCGYELTDKTPDHTYFCKLRARLGTKSMERLFSFVKLQLASRGLVGNCFSMIDSSAIITKTQLWAERDAAIEAGEKKLNNALVSTYTADKDARFGCKGKDKFWFGYKRHVNVDAKAGVITKVAVTAANVTDTEGLRRVCPDSGMALMDKAYCGKEADRILKVHGVHNGAIKKNNMRSKNFDLDSWISKRRMPFEGVFARCRKRARYRGTAKVQLQAFMEAMVWNLKIGAKHWVTSVQMG